VGTLAHATHINTDRLKSRRSKPADVATFSVTYDPNGFSGWHTHPAIVLSSVQSGVGRCARSAAESHAYNAGDAFIESDAQAGGPGHQPELDHSPVLTVMQVVPHGSAGAGRGGSARLLIARRMARPVPIRVVLAETV